MNQVKYKSNLRTIDIAYCRYVSDKILFEKGTRCAPQPENVIYGIVEIVYNYVLFCLDPYHAVQSITERRNGGVGLKRTSG